MGTVSGKVTGAGGKGFSAEIRIEGYEETIAALRSLEPDVQKRMLREIKAQVEAVGAAASGSGPSGHSLMYKVRTRRGGKKAGMSLVAVDRDTAIFEFAGTKNLSRTGGPITPQGAAMVKWLDGFGKPGRFMWAAWDARKESFEAEITRQMKAAEELVQSKLSAAGEVF